MNHPPLAALPYRRWFLWLLVGCLLALVMPYANRGDGQFYSPSIGTFVQTERGLAPTTGPIWIDSRTAVLVGGSGVASYLSSSRRVGSDGLLFTNAPLGAVTRPGESMSAAKAPP